MPASKVAANSTDVLECTICGLIKPRSQFRPQSRQCVECRKAYYINNREAEILRVNKWVAENPERRKKCNFAIGLLDDNKDLAKLVVEYLEKYS